MGATGEQAGEAASTDCASGQAFPLKQQLFFQNFSMTFVLPPADTVS